MPDRKEDELALTEGAQAAALVVCGESMEEEEGKEHRAPTQSRFATDVGLNAPW